MATKQKVTATPQSEGTPMYAVINKTNMLDPLGVSQQTFATEAEAEAQAEKVLNNQATADVYTVKLLKRFKATVSIEATPVDTPAE